MKRAAINATCCLYTYKIFLLAQGM